MTAASNVQIDLLLETGGGGSGRHVLDLFTELRRTGWNAHLILSNRRADLSFLAEVAQLPHDQVTFLNIRRSPHVSDLVALAKLRSYIASSDRPHLLHAHSTKAGILGCGLGRLALRKILTPHAFRGMDPTLQFPKSEAIRCAERAFSSAYDTVIAVSPEEQAYMISTLRIPRDRICYIPNGVDASGIRDRVNILSARRGARARPVIGFVGRMVHQKDPALFLEAFRTVVERGAAVRAVIVGDGPLRAGLEANAASCGLSHLIDWRGEASGVDELAGMDVVVHTSRYESFPYALLEAAAACIPIVAVENSGSRAILGEDLPEAITTAADPGKLADAILDALQDGPVRGRHLAALEAVSRRFKIQKMAQATIRVYESALQASTLALNSKRISER